VVRPDQFPKLSRVVLRLMGGRYGDFRDWVEIDRWADQIAADLMRSQRSCPAPITATRDRRLLADVQPTSSDLAASQSASERPESRGLGGAERPDHEWGRDTLMCNPVTVRTVRLASARSARIMSPVLSGVITPDVPTCAAWAALAPSRWRGCDRPLSGHRRAGQVRGR
jgi:hypothetical protein